MKLIQILSIIYFTSILSILHAKSLICSDIYTTITNQKGNKPIKSNGSKDNGKTKITIEFGKKHIYIIGSKKIESIYLGSNSLNIYFLEKTDAGNFNLYTLFADDTLVVSKSYYFMGLVKVNVQTIYKCYEN